MIALRASERRFLSSYLRATDAAIHPGILSLHIYWGVMEIVNACKIHVSNAEVYHILKQQKESRDAQGKKTIQSSGDDTQNASSLNSIPGLLQAPLTENVFTIEFEVRIPTRRPCQIRILACSLIRY